MKVIISYSSKIQREPTKLNLVSVTIFQLRGQYSEGTKGNLQLRGQYSEGTKGNLAKIHPYILYIYICIYCIYIYLYCVYIYIVYILKQNNICIYIRISIDLYVYVNRKSMWLLSPYYPTTKTSSPTLVINSHHHPTWPHRSGRQRWWSTQHLLHLVHLGKGSETNLG